jgi:PAS domain S-box-containing protein
LQTLNSMETNLKLQSIFLDRVGIVADVAAIIVANGLNIVSMEVQKKGRFAYVYLDVEKGGTDLDPHQVFARLGKIKNCVEVKKIQTLPQEKREEGYKVVLDSVSDGILSMDEEGRITTINRVAAEIMNCGGAEQVIGKNIRELAFPATGLLECLENKALEKVKRNVITSKGRYQFFSSCKPIKDSADRIVGAVEIMKDMKEIEALACEVSQATQITFSDIVGSSPAIQQAISLAQKIADTEAIVSIRGESGTGKELFARAIADESRRKGPFVPINCAALPETLLESELFGYVGGAFTGASKQGKPGLFEVARDGTVFLDEIADMPLSVQAKILRLIQEQTARRIGGTREISVNPRIITATNKNLEKMVEDDLFREDLYYRINVLPIHIPPLRRRLEDIGPLVDHFLFRLNSRLHKKLQVVDASALAKLNGHHWPGNVRELKNVIERGAILAEGNRIGAECILFGFEIARDLKPAGQIARAPIGHEPLHEMVDRYERQLIEEALGKDLSLRKTAKLLSLSHTGLRNKIHKHRIDLPLK